MKNSDLVFFEEKLNEIPEDVLLDAINCLNNVIPRHNKKEISTLIDRYGSHKWIYAVNDHFHWGMYIRNKLRSSNLPDNLLPDNNWDDYYVLVIEIVVSKRKIPVK